MTETFLFLQQLLALTANIHLAQIPYSRFALAELLQKETDSDYNCPPGEINALWQQLQRSKEAECIPYHLPGGNILLFYPDRQANVIFSFASVSTHPVFGKKAAPPTEEYDLQRICALAYSHLRKGQAVPALPKTELQAEASTLTSEEDIAHMRQVETQYEYSTALTDAVRQGNLSLAMHLIGSYDPNRQTPVRNTNPLRNAQNYCIVLNTQLRHALQESDIHPYQVDRLSGEIGLEIEQLKSTKQLPSFFQQIIRRYCRLVQEHAYPRLKPLTNLAVTYIKEHLADNLTVKDTAKALTINANYLSTLFHQDMGMTFIDFVNQERTRQAAALLRHTNLQIQQIASTVGYNNTSYFAKQFLRFHGITPSHYRREGTA